MVRQMDPAAVTRTQIATTPNDETCSQAPTT
jgi:hypothetical protein